jgi:hypothetical protein
MRFVTREHALWFGIALLAGAMRFSNLDIALSESEAASALSALSAAQGKSAQLLNPLAGLLQMLALALFGATSEAARLIPALAGTAFCLLPMLLRERVGRLRALLLSALLIGSPTVLFASRQATGEMLAWTLALAAIWAGPQRATLRAVLIGLVCANGVHALAPLLCVVLLIVLSEGVVALRPDRRGVAVAGVAFVLGASGFLFRPSGLSDVFDGIASAFAPSGFTSGRLLAGLMLNEPLLIVFGIAAIAMVLVVPAHRSGETDGIAELTRSFAFLAVGMFTVALYPARTAASVIPLVIGLALLASFVLTSLFDALRRQATWVDWSVAGLVFLLTQFSGIMIRQSAANSDPDVMRTPLVALMLCAAIVIASAVNGDWRVGLRGVAVAFIGTLGLYGLGAGLQLTQVRWDNPAEPYVLNASTDRLNALAGVLRTTAMRATGEPDGIPLSIDGGAPASLRWALRDQTRQKSGGETAAFNALVLPGNTKPADARAFVGDEFEIARSGDLSKATCTPRDNGGFDCSTLARWIAFRDLNPSAITNTRWTLWLSEQVLAQSSGQ